MLDFITSEMASALVWIVGNFSLLYDCITSQQMYRKRLFANISSTFFRQEAWLWPSHVVRE